MFVGCRCELLIVARLRWDHGLEPIDLGGPGPTSLPYFTRPAGAAIMSRTDSSGDNGRGAQEDRRRPGIGESLALPPIMYHTVARAGETASPRRHSACPGPWR